ncbi:MAG TPA: DUF3021 domain-containing protein [Lachnospiraceae bacterium]|jgi:hypothetical protein|nr:DUF3021 domain-containing protein [Lachnospiraceae bacterium]
MMKKTFLRCLAGSLFGVAFSYIITIIISLTIGDGNFYPIVPELAADCGSEMNAVLLQMIFSLIYGAAWAGAALIWEREDWSLLRQTVTHFVICSLATFPIAYLLRWMQHSVSGVIIYFSIFIVIYFIIWLSQYMAMKKRVEQINSKMWENSK